MPIKDIDYYERAYQLYDEQHYLLALKAALTALSPQRGPGTKAKTLSRYIGLKILEVRCIANAANLPFEQFLAKADELTALAQQLPYDPERIAQGKQLPVRQDLHVQSAYYQNFHADRLLQANYIFSHAVFLFSEAQQLVTAHHIERKTQKIMSHIAKAMALYQKLGLTDELKESLEQKAFIYESLADKLSKSRTIECLKLADCYYTEAAKLLQHCTKPISNAFQQKQSAVQKKMQPASKKRKATEPEAEDESPPKQAKQTAYPGTLFKTNATVSIEEVITTPSSEQITTLRQLIAHNDRIASSPVPHNPQGDTYLLLALRQQHANTILVLSELLQPVIRHHNILELQLLFNYKDNSGQNAITLARHYDHLEELKEAIAIGAYQVLYDKAENYITSVVSHMFPTAPSVRMG